MKIEKFNESNESNEYFLFIINENYNEYYIFEDYKNAFSFLLNAVYGYFEDNEQVLEELDDINDLVILYDYYEDLYNSWDVTKIEFIRQNKNKSEVSNWINLRRDTKKYNL